MTSTHAHHYPSATLRWAITATVMLVTIMEILDMTIVTVALPPMMGQLSASTDEITWVLTSYIVSSAIVMPLTGFFVSRLGRKRYMLIMIIGFMISSALCGLSQNLSQIVFFRILQGVFGASLVPMSQYILADTFPPQEAGTAMAIWGIGVMIAPILGPTLGGYITHHASWRWVFYINVPVCIIAFFMTMHFIEETVIQKAKTDWFGMALMAIGVGCLQIFLDRGNNSNWFASRSIQVLCFIAAATLITFVARGIYKKDNIINLRLFINRNFTTSTLLLAVFAMSIFSLISIQPLMLEHLMGYSAETAGLLMMPRGLAAAAGMITVAKLIKKIDGRVIVFVGVAITAWGTYLMAHLNLQADFWTMAWQGAIQGYGMGLFFVPVAAFSLSTLRKKDHAEASGLFSFGRNIGSAIGVSIISTIISNQTQTNWHRLGGHITATNDATHHWLTTLQTWMTQKQAFGYLGKMLYNQATMVAFMDAFWAVLLAFVVLLPIVLMLQKVNLEDVQMH